MSRFGMSMCACALALLGCGDDASGPVLRAGPWYGYFSDANDQLRGSISAQVSLDGKITLHIEGKLVDQTTPFAIDTNASVLHEGSNFAITGTEGNQSVTGYGRERVFETMLIVAIPIDTLPSHQLMVGTDTWEFEIQGGADTTAALGSWGVRSLSTGEVNSGTFMAQPGDLPPPDAEDIDALGDGAAPDAHVDGGPS
jgi:hypothetical protein